MKRIIMIAALVLMVMLPQYSVSASSFYVDGEFSEWETIPHTIISYYAPDKNQRHYGALYLEGDKIYGHFKMNDAYRAQMVVTYMNVTINQSKSVPVAIFGCNPDQSINWNKSMSSLPVGTTRDIAVFYNNHPKRYMGDAAFTVYDSGHTVGDEVEFCIDLNVIAEIAGVPVDTIREVSIHNPNIGNESVIMAGGSTGAKISILIAVLFVGTAYFGMSRKSKKRVM